MLFYGLVYIRSRGFIFTLVYEFDFNLCLMQLQIQDVLGFILTRTEGTLIVYSGFSCLITNVPIYDRRIRSKMSRGGGVRPQRPSPGAVFPGMLITMESVNVICENKQLHELKHSDSCF